MSAGLELEQIIRKTLQKKKNRMLIVLLSRNIGLVAVRVSGKSCLVLCKCHFVHTLMTVKNVLGKWFRVIYRSVLS